MSIERKKSELLIKKKNLEAKPELNKTKLRFEELRLKSQAQEHLVDCKLQMRGITEELEGLGCGELSTSSSALPTFVPEAVPQTQQNESANAEQTGRIPVTVSNVASSFPYQPPSTRTALPADAFACPDLHPNQSANLEGILRMFAHSLSEMVTMPRRGMPRFKGDPLLFLQIYSGI